MPKIVVQKTTRDNKQLVTDIRKPENKKVIIQNAKREHPKVPSFSSPALLNQIRSFTNYSDKHYYLGFGGLGDALLLIAICWNDPKAKVVFFANQISFIRSFFELFGISVYLHDNIMGTRMAAYIYDFMKTLPDFKQSAHLADGLNYDDWNNENKYIPRIKESTGWIQHLGKEKSNNPVVIIAPSGSHKDLKRQRFLHAHEHQQLVNLNLDKGYKVYVTGSMSDLHHYKLIDRDNFRWLCSDKIYDGKGNVENSDLKRMLRIINSAEYVISMDTYLKTYSLLCGIPTYVIKTRYNGDYKNIGEDITDLIFLNPKIWKNIKIVTVEEMLVF